MKTAILILALLLTGFGLSAQTSFTNGLKGSLWINAGTLDGTEKVYLVQGTNSRVATVAQINAAPVAQCTAASNYLALVTGTNAANLAAASNYLASVAGTNAAYSLAVSNYLKSVTTANTAYTLGVSNYFAAAGLNYYPTSNPSGWQNAGQVTATANAAAAAAAAGIINSNGTASFNSVTASNVIYSMRVNGSTATNLATLDLSAGSLQTLTYTGSGELTLALSNIAAGQNVTLLLLNSSGGLKTVNYPANVMQLNGSATVSYFT
jgi:hypothetical protein